MEMLLRDVRYALRRLARAPVFAGVAVSTLAIAIGANSAVFSVVNGVLLEPLSFDEPDRLVGLWHTAPGLDSEWLPQSAALHFTYLDANRSFEGVGMWADGSVSVAGMEAPEKVDAISLTHTTLAILRVRPMVGRLLSERDDSPGAPPTVLLGHGFWQTRFGGDPGVVGQMLTVDGQAREVIGVLPADLQFLDYDPSVYLPLQLDPNDLIFSTFNHQGVARLRPGVSMEQANADVARMIPLAVERFPGGFTEAMLEEARFAPRLRPLKEDVVGDIGNVLWVLFGTVGIMLLIACANVGNLFLVRANERQTEVAVRAAMGASHGALAREFLTESMTLGLLGGAGGLMLTHAGVALLQALAPDGLPRLDEIAIRPVVLLFTLGLALLVGLLFGLVPLLGRGGELSRALREGGERGGRADKARSRARDTLVVAQMALALVLLVGAGLMIRSLLAMGEVRPGFERPEEVLAVRVDVPSAEIAEPEQVALAYEQMLRNLQAIPGVSSVGGSSRVTMDGGDSNAPLGVEGFFVAEGQFSPTQDYKWVLPGYFETMQNKVLAGRSITWAEIHARASVAVITKNLALEYWSSAAEAIGKRVRAEAPTKSGQEPPWREVIGVVGDVRDDGIAQDPVPTVYWPVINRQFWGADLMVRRTMTFVVRSPRIRTAGFMDEVRTAIWAVNPNLPLTNVRTLREILARSMARTSFAFVMLMIASSAALLLGVVGIYGVTSYAVAQRRHELGLRVALGAQRGDVSRLVLRHTFVLAGVGTVSGVAMAIGLTRWLSALLYGVSPVDPLTFAAVTFAVAATALVASYLPARRAARVDPVTALRGK